MKSHSFIDAIISKVTWYFLIQFCAFKRENVIFVFAIFIPTFIGNTNSNFTLVSFFTV